MKNLIYIMLIVFLLSGCTSLEEYIMGAKVTIEHPSLVSVYRTWFGFSGEEELLALKKVEEYLSKEQNVSWAKECSLKTLKAEEDMNKEEVLMVLGEPSEKIHKKNNTELWIYDEYPSSNAKNRYRILNNRISKITFQDDIVINHNRKWISYSRTPYHVRKRIEEYILANPLIEKSIKESLKELKVQKGMDKEQVKLLVGNPTEIEKLSGSEELWMFKGDRLKKKELEWYYQWGKMKFKNDRLFEIELQKVEYNM
ncbi:MAG: hypothetical protein PHY73_01365 [Candidatus Omnitrophica bacterium]|nr:hypothetical protein [Candidatus Omnitrophota bacterium]